MTNSGRLWLGAKDPKRADTPKFKGTPPIKKPGVNPAWSKTQLSIAVVVVGEDPYAEMKGDRSDLALSADDVAAVSDAKAAGVPVVVVVLSGRPLVLGSVADQADAIVAAWLPGTEGQGVADVLFGDAPPTGRLSFTWPRSMGQVPLGHGKAAIQDPLFPFGFGTGF